jgi:Conjugative transposon protein TcpC
LSAEHESADGGRRIAAVSIATRPLWRLRLLGNLPRYLLYATCAFGLAASARLAIAPPRRSLRTIEIDRASPDLAARSYAVLFARRYLTWDASSPQPDEEALASMTSSSLDPYAGLTLPARGSQRVLWAEVAQERTPSPGRNVYTLAVQTDTSGLLYMTVTVVREANGRLAIAGYPAFVGAPLAAQAQPLQAGVEVAEPALAVVVERALHNYLAASPQELDADLASGAEIALPEMSLTLDSVQRLAWSPDRRSVTAVVQAHDARGVAYTLAYEADVEELQGRWEISAIQTNPTE